MPKSIKKNVFYNIIKTATDTILPLIAFPYLTRTLTPTYIGKIDFGATFVGYFSLLATLGVDVYAVRECAKVRDNKKRLEEVSSQIFSINICMMVISYVLMSIALLAFRDLDSYDTIIYIFSLNIVFGILGTTWLNNAMEDFKFITLVSFFLQLISLISVFIFIKSPSDYILRVGLSVFPIVILGVINTFYRRRFCKVRFVWKMNFKTHIVSIAMLFGMLVSQTIFNNSDIIMLGLIRNDYEVGIYSTAVKCISIVAQLIGSILWVVLPKLSILFGSDDKKGQRECLGKVFSFLVTLGIPCTVGLFAISDEIILMIGGAEYADASMVLKILAISFLFSQFGIGLCGNFILLPAKKEKEFMIACTITAVSNILANLFVIPLSGAIGAAITTAAGNFLGLIILLPMALRVVVIDKILKRSMGPIIGGVCIFILCYLVHMFVLPFTARIITCIFGSVVAYFIVLVITKNESLIILWNSITQRSRKIEN